MNHKEITAHIRRRMKANGVNARVKMDEYCGTKVITVSVPNAAYVWSNEEAKEIAVCVMVNRLTGARGTPIDIAHEVSVLSGTTYASRHYEFHGVNA